MDTGLEHLKSQTIEISAADRNRGKRAHILGYYVEPDHPALTGLCQPTVEPSTKRREAWWSDWSGKAIKSLGSK